MIMGAWLLDRPEIDDHAGGKGGWPTEILPDCGVIDTLRS
jgi:hypothetical protein